jgi:MFS family permease
MAYAIPIDWNKTELQAIALFFFMGFGKALGGVLADTIGYRKTTYLSLLLALPLLLFGNQAMWVSLIGVMLFSMTMPITVAVLLSKFPRSPGLAFGITTFGLFMGMLPKFFIELNGLWTHRIVTAVLSCLAFICIRYCLKKEKKDVI